MVNLSVSGLKKCNQTNVFSVDQLIFVGSHGPN